MQMISIHLNKHNFDYVKHNIKNGAKLIEHCMFVVYYQSMIRNLSLYTKLSFGIGEAYKMNS
jgi:hypothetical protein